ncbi:MAG: hypothetical protein GKR97_12895 [Rhizobiaceae bacterium]|nr:hypothetical protein [Rhizobiaceae bacterium]
MQTSSTTQCPPAKWYSRIGNVKTLTVAALVACAVVGISGYVAIQFLEQVSALSTAHAIAGLAIAVLVLPFLILTGMLLCAMFRSGRQTWLNIGPSFRQPNPVKVAKRRIVRGQGRY